MSEVPAKFFHRTLLAGAASLALLVGVAAAPAVLSLHANAQEITPSQTAVTPPGSAPMSFADLIQHVRPAVVSIQVRQRPDAAQDAQAEGLPPGFEDFFGNRGPNRPGPAPMALGSGFFIGEDGTIVTNHHVIDGAEQITVKTSDGRELPADIIGSDELTDLAVLRVRGGGHFPFVRFDTDPDVRVGDWVVAVGNPFGLEGTATAGIVSAMGRRDAGSSSYVDYMQIDAPINRGNSGGPTFDLRGRVIGVNSAIFSPTGGNVGIGFAIPADTAARVVTQLEHGGRVARGWLGVTIQPLDDDIAHSLGLPNTHGALVANVTPDGPAQRAGIQQGDVILRLNGHDVSDSRELTQLVGASEIGHPAQLDILRAGQRRTLSVRLAERPSEQQLASANGPRTTPDQDSGKPDAGSQSAALGASVRALSADDRARLNIAANEGGLLITDVDSNSDLAEKGVGPGDVILQAGGRAVRTSQDLASAADAAHRAGRPLLLQVQGRSGQRGYIAVNVGAG
ncbi:MAG TPA: Do family serine endopeptidase [Caulobacterales bacterium]|nr:Do family serine endopeptidase [Caulobacterales bacterium]